MPNCFHLNIVKKIYVSYIALQMCLLDQTAYLVLLAVYVSCADRWLLCILCPCVYLTIGMLSYSYTLIQLPFLLPVFVTDFLLYYMRAIIHIGIRD